MRACVRACARGLGEKLRGREGRGGGDMSMVHSDALERLCLAVLCTPQTRARTHTHTLTQRRPSTRACCRVAQPKPSHTHTRHQTHTHTRNTHTHIHTHTDTHALTRATGLGWGLRLGFDRLSFGCHGRMPQPLFFSGALLLCVACFHFSLKRRIQALA